jgi:mRNA-degrading endonuclease toxin of MazEF toxin-antitoxin module
MKRGGVYWADLVPRSGSEQTGRRPVIVVSHDGFNQALA